MATERGKQRRGSGARRAGKVGWALILIDQDPLRRSAVAACREVMDRLEVVRSGWHRFEREDRPAFVRWRAREFGAILSEAREVESQISEAQALVREVEVEMRRMFQSPQSAYQRIMYRRQNPGMEEDEGPDKSEAGPAGTTRKVSEFEQEALFQEWVQKFLGTNPDKMDDEAYSTTFEVFKAHMFKSVQAEKTNRTAGNARPRDRLKPEPEPEEPQTPEEGTAMDGRVKELYRRLVRRLHPDLRADGSADVSALWHEVQEAYAANDVARMEILLALSSMRTNELGDETTLAQMHSVLAELERSLWALEKSLSEAEEEEAWNFARTGPNDNLKMRVQRQLRFDLATRMRHLEVLQKTIADWARGAVMRRSATAPGRRQYA